MSHRFTYNIVIYLLFIVLNNKLFLSKLEILNLHVGGTNDAQWEDVTGSTPLTFMNDRVSFTTTVSARFWLMDYRNVCEVPRMATELYKESLYVPFITK